jgi:CO/xanthine dehydrogenase FAD-binding subunit
MSNSIALAASSHTDRELRDKHRAALLALAETRVRCEQAERRLQHGVAELAWPAVLAFLAGGTLMVLTLRLAGF